MENYRLNKTVESITRFIKGMMEDIGRDGGVIGISGGLDSAVTAALAVRALGPDKVLLINMPERDCNRIHQKHAKMLAKSLGCKLIRRSVTNVLFASRTYSLLPIQFIPLRILRKKIIKCARDHIIKNEPQSLLLARLRTKAYSWEAKANAYAMSKHRVRMMMLYQFAEVRNLMVIGAANRTEWCTGTFSKFGVDHCSDIMPIIHLFRSEVEELASWLEIPEYILEKDADPDLLPGLDDKQKLLGNFEQVDKILMGLERTNDLTLLNQDFNPELVEKICGLKTLSEPMRLSPYRLERK